MRSCPRQVAGVRSVAALSVVWCRRGGRTADRGVCWRRRLVVGAGLLIVFSVAAIGLSQSRTDTVAFLGRPARGLGPSGSAVTAPRGAEPLVDGTIRAENLRPGSAGWQIADGDKKPRPIEGFADRVSGLQGDRLRLFVTTHAPSFRVLAYRTGWYGGIGARLVWSSAQVAGSVQPQCGVLPATRTVDCSNWAQSLTVQIGRQWVPGQYLLKLVQPDGGASFVPLVVRNDRSHAAIVVVASVTTIEAYNGWGGFSLYGDYAGRAGNRATVVSFDRPFGGWANSGFILGDTFEVAQMLESQGLEVTYTTDVDLHEHPDLLGNHRVVISGAHDEYYSLEMRNGLKAARDRGVNIVFLGANAIFRRIRFQTSPLGVDRREVNYRSAVLDPLAKLDPARVTTNWRDPPRARPERALTGTDYECNQGGLSADMVVSDAAAWMFRATHVTQGEHFPNVVRGEYDRVIRAPGTPPGIEVLTHSPLRCGGRQSWSDMAYYVAASGAGVVDVGTLMFEPHLAPLCAPADLDVAHWECQLRQTMNNIITSFAQGPAGSRHPARSNIDPLGITGADGSQSAE